MQLEIERGSDWSQNVRTRDIEDHYDHVTYAASNNLELKVLLLEQQTTDRTLVSCVEKIFGALYYEVISSSAAAPAGTAVQLPNISSTSNHVRFPLTMMIFKLQYNFICLPTV